MVGGCWQFRTPHAIFRNQRLTGMCKGLGNGGAMKSGAKVQFTNFFLLILSALYIPVMDAARGFAVR